MASFYSDISSLNRVLTDLVKPYSSVFILCDENTEVHCLPLIKEVISGTHILTISSGEKNKNLQTCEKIWDALTDKAADRRSLLVNLGGGVICDMCGFAASCYKRGIDFINIPTTLLAMVDASVGGKTGIDFHNYKNQIGLFSEAKETLICNAFLQTLDNRQLRSGLAEIVKHYLIADREAFIHLSPDSIPIYDIALIQKAVEIKSAIVAQDPLEKSVRKKLNFGHTIGHALESHSFNTDEHMLHGEAVAYGMAVETIISALKGFLTEEEAGLILQKLRSLFTYAPLSDTTINALLANTLQDKKNDGGEIRMSLINGIGRCKIDVPVSKEEIRAAIALFNKTASHII